MRKELTNEFARNVAPIPGKISRYFDTHKRSPRGFLLRVTPAGAGAWALQYRVDGRQREITIGDPKSWPITEARRRGHELRRDIDAGGDPLGKREEARLAPTVEQLVERFVAEELPKRAPRTQDEWRAMVRDWILPALGKRRVADVKRDDVERLHTKITKAGKPRRANSVRSAVATLFAQAVTWEMRNDNPAKGVKGNPEHGRERYLNEAEVARLLAVLERWHDKRPDSVDAIMLAILTGARRGELLSMRWADLDLDQGVWTKPAALTKQRKLHRVPLSADVVAVLRQRQSVVDKVVPLRAPEHVFRGAGDKAHTCRLEKDWFVIRAAAGLEDVRFHDLRHSYASMLVSAGLSLPVIGAMLGHSKSATTQRYSHLADKPLRDAAEIVAKKLTRQ
jgi:integrase